MRPNGGNRPASAHHLMRQEMHMQQPTTCKIEGCEQPRETRGWCQPHYQRWWRKGDPGPAILPKYGLIEFCTAPGCGREHRTKGYCDMHYRRFKRGVPVDSIRFRTIPKPPNKNSYGAVHMRLAAERGPAKNYSCPCGEPAQQWAYQHNDPAPLFNPAGMPYSTDLFGCYEAMCISCHNRFDYDLDERAARGASTQ